MVLATPLNSEEPFLSMCVSSLFRTFGSLTEEEDCLMPLLDRLCTALWPNHDHTTCPMDRSICVSACTEGAWKLLPTRMLVSLTVLCCRTIPPHTLVATVRNRSTGEFQTTRRCILRETVSQSIIKPSIMSHLVGYSLVYGWAECFLATGDGDKLSKLLALTGESPYLNATHVHLWALLHHGEYLMSKGRFVDARQRLEAIWASTEAEEDEDCSVTEIRDRAYVLLCELSNRGDVAENIYAKADVTLVVEFLASTTKMEELDHILQELDRACCKGSKIFGDFDHKRAQSMLDHFTKTPRLRFTRIHLGLLYMYGHRLCSEGEEDAAEALWTQVISLPAPHNIKPELLEVQARTLIWMGQLLHKDGSGTEHFKNCLHLLKNAPASSMSHSRHLYLLTEVYLLLNMPEEALSCLVEFLHAFPEGHGSLHLCDIFLKIAEAAVMLEDFSFAIELAEQARFACQELGDGIFQQYLMLQINNYLAELLYWTGQLERTKEYNTEAYEVALQIKDPTLPQVLRTVRLRGKVHSAFVANDGWRGFRMPLYEAFGTACRAQKDHVDALPQKLRERLSLDWQPVKVYEQRYEVMKQQKKKNFVEIMEVGLNLCSIYMSDEETDKARQLVKELYQLLVSKSNNFKEIDSETLELAIRLGDEGSALELWSEPYHLFSVVLRHIARVQVSLTHASDETSMVESSNYYKTVFSSLIDLCMKHKQLLLAYVWSQRSRSRALTAQLSRLYDASYKSGFAQVHKNLSFIDQPQFDNDTRSVVSSVIECIKACRTLVLEYTVLPPENVLISITEVSPQTGELRMNAKLINLEEFLTDDTKQQAQDEFKSVADKLFENYSHSRPTNSGPGEGYFESFIDGGVTTIFKGNPHTRRRDATAGTSSQPQLHYVAPRMVAENRVRGQISSVLCQGLVASTQRLAAEAENALERKDVRTAQQKAREMKILYGKLYKAFIGPLDMDFTGNDILLIVPDEDLGLLPFSAFYNDMSGKYLIEEIAVAMAPSLRITSFCKEVYEQMCQAAPLPELVVGRTAGYPEGWSSLKNAEREMQAVRSCFSSAGRYLYFEPDDQNAKNTVLSQIKGASWLHFTVHGQVSPEFPRSGLVLGKSNEERLHADEIAKCGPLSARGVVLSACETGLGAIRGEGILGLVRAFILAGAPLVISSIWKVPDEFTATYMSRLYKILSEKVCVPMAMQQVAIEFINKRQPISLREINLLKWSAFMCVGYPRVFFPNVDPS